MFISLRRGMLQSYQLAVLNRFASSNIAFFGGGQMCEAILGALQIKGTQDMSKIVVCDLNKDRVQYLHTRFGVRATLNPIEAVENVDLVVMAVKPQNATALATTLKSSLAKSQPLILSILAGVTVSDLRKLFGSQRIIRSMPNTPAMVLEGITVWIATPETPQEMVEQARMLLSSFGDQIQVHEEHYIDMATAVSGSGPGYVFLTMEAMIDAAVHLGFPRNIATKLVTATIKGSAAYAQQSEQHISKLRNNVTSPGGTTASALYELERGGFRTVVADAIWAAYRRTLELGGQDSNVGPGRSRPPINK